MTPTCLQCRHFSPRVRSCLDPIGAGLLLRDHGYGIVYPEIKRAPRCPAFDAKRRAH